jgi:hypothetical protein
MNGLRMKRIARNSALVLALAGFCTGCPPDPVPDPVEEISLYSDSSIAFRILRPGSHEEVNSKLIDLLGTGIKTNVSSFRVVVNTDGDYIQDGKFYLKTQGDWTYSGVHLEGTGQHLYHDVTAEVTYIDGRKEVSSIVGVFVKEEIDEL